MRIVLLTAAFMVSVVSCAGVDDDSEPGNQDVQATSAISRQAPIDFASMSPAELAAFVPTAEDFLDTASDGCHASNCSGAVACTGWSGEYQCGEDCDYHWKCDFYGENGRYRLIEQFQICWDINGNQCENFQLHARFAGCGC